MKKRNGTFPPTRGLLRGLALGLALCLCLALLPMPARAEAGTTKGLTPEVAQAYLAVVDGLAAKYGTPMEIGTGVWGYYLGMCGGYVVDLGGGATPELIVRYDEEEDYEYAVCVYAWDGSAAVLVQEYQAYYAASASIGFYLETSGGEGCVHTFFNGRGGGGSSEDYARFDGQKMVDIGSNDAYPNTAMCEVGPNIDTENYEELRALLRSAGANPIDVYCEVTTYILAYMGVSVSKGYAVWTDAQPMIRDDRTLVPLRAAAEALGLEVEWDGANKTAVFRGIINEGGDYYSDRVVRFPVGGKTITVETYASYSLWEDDEYGVSHEVGYVKDELQSTEFVSMDTVTLNLDGRTYAPIRYLAEAFNSTVEWDGDTRTVKIVRYVDAAW